MKKRVLTSALTAATLLAAGSAMAGTLTMSNNARTGAAGPFEIATEVIKGKDVVADIGNWIAKYTPKNISLPGGIVDPQVNGTLVTLTLSDAAQKWTVPGTVNVPSATALELCKVGGTATDKIAGYVTGVDTNILTFNGTSANQPVVNNVDYAIFYHDPADATTAGNCKGAIAAGDLQLTVAQNTTVATTVKADLYATVVSATVPQDSTAASKMIDFQKGMTIAAGTVLNNTIDTAQSFKKFTDGTTYDILKFTASAVALEVPVTPQAGDTLTIKIKPSTDTSLLASATAFKGAANATICDTIAGNCAVAGDAGVNWVAANTACTVAGGYITCSAVTNKATYVGNEQTIQITTDGATTAIDAKTFLASAEVTWKAGSTDANDTLADGLWASPAATSVGAWTVNGFSGVIPYLYRGTVQDMTTYCLINNAGSQTASLYFTPKTVDGGVAIGAQSVGTIAAGASRLAIITGQNKTIGNAAVADAIYFSDASASAVSLASMTTANRYSANILVTGTPKNISVNCQQLDPSGAKRLVPVLVDNTMDVVTGAATYLTN